MNITSAQPLLTPDAFWSFDLTLEQAQKVFEIHSLGIVTSVERVKRGEVSAVFRVQRHDATTLFTKVHVRSLNPELLIREKLVIDYLRAQSDLPIPYWYVVSEPNEHISYPYALVDEAVGVDADIVWPKLNQQQREKLMQSAGRCLSQLHRVPIPAELLQQMGSVVDLSAYAESIEMLFQNALEQLEIQGWFPGELLMDVQRVWRSNQHVLDIDCTFSIVHYDYQLHNLRVDPTSLEVVAVLDFGNVTVGPSVTDARDLEIGCFINEPELRTSFWNTYGLSHNLSTSQQIIWLNGLVRTLDMLASYWGATPDGLGTDTIERLLALLEGVQS